MRFAALTAPLLLVLPFAFVPVACGGTDGGSGAGADDGGDPPNLEAGPGPGDTGVVTPTDSAAPDAPVTTACKGKIGASGDRTVTIMSGGRERTYDLHVPAKYDPTKRTPLVFVFHGYTMTATTGATSIAGASHFADTADARGMIVAFPTGIGTGFNAGDCCGTAASTMVDDIGFTRDMIGTIDGEYCVDPKRVFSTGLSNGGFFSYTLACELSDKIAAVASVSGVLGVDPAKCNPKRPVPVLHIHGTNDVVVPYNGGGISSFRSVSQTVDAWKAKDTCVPVGGGAGKVVYTKGDVTCTSFAPCAAGTDVELCTVSGGGHQWPGGSLLPYGLALTTDLVASDAIADFFEAHPLP